MQIIIKHFRYFFLGTTIGEATRYTEHLKRTCVRLWQSVKSTKEMYGYRNMCRFQWTLLAGTITKPCMSQSNFQLHFSMIKMNSHISCVKL